MRVFIAVPVGNIPSVIRYIDELKREFSGEYFKWTVPSQLHFTLNFLGETGEEVMNRLPEKLASALSTVESGIVDITGPGYFGKKNLPSVLWLGTDNNQLLKELWIRVSKAVGEVIPGETDTRFSPHLTVARIKRINDTERFHEIVTNRKADRIHRLNIEKVILYKSDLRPEGPLYTPLNEFRLR